MKPEESANKIGKNDLKNPNPESLQIMRNFEDPLDPLPARPKLTREDIFWTDKPKEQNLDPRFKSPDEFLKKAAPNRIKSQPPQPPAAKETPMPSAPEPMQLNSEPVIYGQPDLSDIRQELEKERVFEPAPAKINIPLLSDQDLELTQWKEYARQVKLWHKQVLSIFQNMRAQLKKAESAQAEIQQLKHQIALKDKELAELRSHHGPGKILSWLKGA